jgi:hypothetical protein
MTSFLATGLKPLGCWPHIRESSVFATPRVPLSIHAGMIGSTGAGAWGGAPGFVAGKDLRAAEVAAIGNGLEGIGLQYCLCLPGHIGELRPISSPHG